ncbi:MAG: alpha/beta fold hydrolase [Patescibacteria group bacterium]
MAKFITVIISCLLLATACNNQGTTLETADLSKINNNTSEAKDLHPVSLPALMQKQFNGRDLALGKVLDDNSAYTRYYITYKSGSLTISGIMNIPKGTPPIGGSSTGSEPDGWPVLFLNHGHIDTSVYTNGRGLRREQDYFARHGFAVLHSDYRNHAESDDDPNSENNFRLGYTEDVINAVLAVQNSKLDSLSKTKFGMLGHSMGGGITQNVLVVKPGLIKAAVLYASVSPRQSDNFERWTLGRRQVSERIMTTYPAPGEEVCNGLVEGINQKYPTQPDYLINVQTWCAGEKNLEFWDNLSAENFFERISEPMLYFHGDKDDSVPFEWSQKSLKNLKDLNKNVSLIEYRGQPHEFTPPTWNIFMNKSAEFFKQNLK